MSAFVNAVSDRSHGRLASIADATTMLGRNLRHLRRDPTALLASFFVPVMLLVLFAGVFGGTFTAGLADTSTAGRYIDYVVPGILLISMGYGASTTAQVVNRDMTEGIIARFRTMGIARASVLTGHVLEAMLRTMLSIGLVVGVAVLMGFRPSSGPVEWIAALGLMALLVLALTWLAVATGLLAKSAEGTAPFGVIVQVLPFVSSAFAPTESMPAGVRWFAQNEPFTPIINTLRGLLSGPAVGDGAVIAVAWCGGLALVGYLWARMLFQRDPVR
jgi:ABC-2 type transport system permease protein